MNWQKFAGSCAAALVTGVAHSTVIVDTMPRPGDPTGFIFTGASFQWNDIAVGFRISSAGWLTGVDTLPTPGPASEAGFTFGLASNDLIGNPNPSGIYASQSAGSLWATSVCSPGPNPLEPTNPSACANTPSEVQVGPNETFSMRGLNV
jgi:hypothetical protein